MVADPRCPECDGKVSATATWCMHCGVDFDHPVEADSGAPIDGPDRTNRTWDRETEALGAFDVGPTLAAVGVAVLGLVTVPLVAPANVTLAFLAAILGVAVYAARQATVTEALQRGLQSLAAVPLVLWLLATLFVGSAGSLFGPAAYGVVLSLVGRQFD